MTPFKLSLSGRENFGKEFQEEDIRSFFEIEQSIELSQFRSPSDNIDISLNQEKLVLLTTSDDVEWIGYADDIPEICGSGEVSRSANQVYYLNPSVVNSRGPKRSSSKGTNIKSLDVIVSGAAKIAAIELGRKLDEHACPNPGLHRLDISKNVVDELALPVDQKCLILIHGTFSSYDNGYKNMASKSWETLFKHYKGQVFAFNHKTITHSPFENALDLLRELPDQVEVDIISHSRGGLVADILARCDVENDIKGFDEDDFNVIKKEGVDEKSIETMHDINAQCIKKNITINKIVRVACPSGGTTLLSKRLDHFLNAALNLIGKPLGGRVNPVYRLLKLFLLKVVQERCNPEVFPGLWAMVPDSGFQKINNRDIPLANDLLSISGDAEVGSGFKHSLFVFLTNLYFWRANDFVVDTRSMTAGILRRKSNQAFHIKNKRVDHFNYFSDQDHMRYVESALVPDSRTKVSWENVLVSDEGRGVVLNAFNKKDLFPTPESGEKPVVVLIPGIMGTNIYYQGEKNWLDFPSLNKGALPTKLSASNYEKTQTNSIIANYYQQFHDFLIKKKMDVVVVPYDWRQSLSTQVSKLDDVISRLLKGDKSIRIVAHSMGGILVRQWKIEKPNVWASFRGRMNAKFIMLGTPWKGSHLITEVLTGHSKRIKQLHLLDFKHTKRELLASLVEHDGIYNLLPIDDERLDKIDTWKNLQKVAGDKNMAPIPEKRLSTFLAFKKKISKHIDLTEEDKKITYYVAGKARATKSDYEIRRSFFRDKYIKYLSTPEGDGSVTWSSGIPPGLNSANLYYIDVEHGDLASEPSVFDGLYDLLLYGKTSKREFSRYPPVSRNKNRGVGQGIETSVDIGGYSNIPADNIFGFQRTNTDTSEQNLLNVEVFNGDLKWAKYPVMVGHFKHDGIVSAERTIDKYLDKKLSERHQMGFYPKEIGDQEIIYDSDNSPKGTIVVGLGEKDQLTGFKLSKTVEKAVLKYAVFFRDNMHSQDATSQNISTLIIGSNYGQLPFKESVRSIIMGIQNANKIISQYDELKPITSIEFVDYYEDNAYECYKVLEELEEEDNQVRIALKNQITKGYRCKKRLLRDESKSWWQSLSVERKIIQGCGTVADKEYLDFGAYTRQASSSQLEVYTDLEQARYFADALSENSDWDKIDSKVLFEMLVPNAYKDFIRNHRNIELRLDEHAAIFPWEMFYDFEYGNRPAFIESGLIRQLYGRDVDIQPALVRSKTALVIANPEYDDPLLPNLLGAEQEGDIVAQQLDNASFDVQLLKKSNSKDINRALFGEKYKILHIASHGFFEPENDKVGIAIGDGRLLKTGTIQQLSSIPEFVFINCCYSGAMDQQPIQHMRAPNRLAANVGTQLMKMGVKAIVVAGWAVHDDAANLFAKTLYAAMLRGGSFGDAVKLARRACYDKYEKYNTWGAYQCYGDQFYHLVEGYTDDYSESQLSLEQEIVLALDNLLSKVRNIELSKGDMSKVAEIEEDMIQLVGRSKVLGKYSSQIIEREAMIFSYLGKYTEAIYKYRELFGREGMNFKASAMDTYCNIRAKNLVACDNEICAYTGDTIEKVVEDMGSLKLLGLTPMRNSTIGSTYKRVALLNQDSIERYNALKKSSKFYLAAAKQIGVEKRTAIYQITSYITIISFANALKPGDTKSISISRSIGENATSYLNKWKAIVDKDTGDRTDIYDQLAKIQIRMVQLLLKSSGRKEVVSEIIDLYKIQIDRSINLKDLIGEIEWIDFYIKMGEKCESKYKKSTAYFKDIKSYLEQYYEW